MGVMGQTTPFSNDGMDISGVGSSVRRDAIEHGEGKLTRAVEMQTARIPSMFWLALAGGAIGLSLGVKLAGYDKAANFVGQWVPTILLLGIYNKLVKEHV